MPGGRAGRVEPLRVLPGRSVRIISPITYSLYSAVTTRQASGYVVFGRSQSQEKGSAKRVRILRAVSRNMAPLSFRTMPVFGSNIEGEVLAKPRGFQTHPKSWGEMQCAPSGWSGHRGSKLKVSTCEARAPRRSWRETKKRNSLSFKHACHISFLGIGPENGHEMALDSVYGANFRCVLHHLWSHTR